jgi:hypothetical protein
MIFFVFFSLCGYEIPKKNVLVGLRYLSLFNILNH